LAEVAVLLGCVSQDDTMDQLLANIGEAIPAGLEATHDLNMDDLHERKEEALRGAV
jgi:predicted RNase H-like HicB family nuclease